MLKNVVFSSVKTANILCQISTTDHSIRITHFPSSTNIGGNFQVFPYHWANIAPTSNTGVPDKSRNSNPVSLKEQVG